MLTEEGKRILSMLGQVRGRYTATVTHLERTQPSAGYVMVDDTERKQTHLYHIPNLNAFVELHAVVKRSSSKYSDFEAALEVLKLYYHVATFDRR